MGGMASQLTSLTIVYSSVYSSADQRKHQSPAWPAFVRGINLGPVNSPHKWPVTRKLFPFDDVIMDPKMAWDLYTHKYDVSDERHAVQCGKRFHIMAYLTDMLLVREYGSVYITVTS